MLQMLRADELLGASFATSLADLRHVLESAATRTDSVAKISAKALGDLDKDLVYVPVTPCRLVDTRNTYAAVYQNGGPFTTSEIRSYTLQGGNGVCMTQLPPSVTPGAVMLQVYALPIPGASGDVEVLPQGGTFGSTLNAGLPFQQHDHVVVDRVAGQHPQQPDRRTGPRWRRQSRDGRGRLLPARSWSRGPDRPDRRNGCHRTNGCGRSSRCDRCNRRHRGSRPHWCDRRDGRARRARAYGIDGSRRRDRRNRRNRCDGRGRQDGPQRHRCSDHGRRGRRLLSRHRDDDALRSQGRRRVAADWRLARRAHRCDGRGRRYRRNWADGSDRRYGCHRGTGHQRRGGSYGCDRTDRRNGSERRDWTYGRNWHSGHLRAQCADHHDAQLELPGPVDGLHRPVQLLGWRQDHHVALCCHERRAGSMSSDGSALQIATSRRSRGARTR
jgi:hypothetical protein